MESRERPNDLRLKSGTPWDPLRIHHTEWHPHRIRRHSQALHSRKFYQCKSHSVKSHRVLLREVSYRKDRHSCSCYRKHSEDCIVLQHRLPVSPGLLTDKFRDFAHVDRPAVKGMITITAGHFTLIAFATEFQIDEQSLCHTYSQISGRSFSCS